MLRCHYCFGAFKERKDLEKHLGIHEWMIEQARRASSPLLTTTSIDNCALRNCLHCSTIKVAEGTGLPGSCFTKDKKNAETLPLKDVEHEHLIWLSSRLDYAATGNDYKKLAVLFSIPKEDVIQLSISQLRGERPTEQLIRLLNYSRPEMTMKTFQKKCEEIQRFDVASYIKMKVYKDD